MADNYALRSLETFEELTTIQHFEKRVWGMPSIPVHQTFTAIKNGGIMLGAYDGDRLIAFSYSFPGYKNGRIYLCSHMLGVDPDYQKAGIGQELKRHQRVLAAEKGYRLMTWTYDPLESLNGYLNLTKLGAVVCDYVEKMYGDMPDSLNQGLDSDRFVVEWNLDQTILFNVNPENLNLSRSICSWSSTNKGYPFLEDFEDEALLKVIPQANQWKIPIPAFFQSLKKEDYSLATDWRLKTRILFQSLLSIGFRGYKLTRDVEHPVSYYEFVKDKSTR